MLQAELITGLLGQPLRIGRNQIGTHPALPLELAKQVFGVPMARALGASGMERLIAATINAAEAPGAVALTML